MLGPTTSTPLRGQAATMLEQQERGAVQADRGLARAGSTLHDEALIERGTDHDVLLGLDRGDDLAHRTGARRADLGQHRVGHAGRGDRVRIVELLVEVRGEITLDHREPSAMAEAERIDAGRPVERRSDRRPPVDDDRVVGVVLDVAAADVPAVGVLVGDPAEEVAGTGLCRSSSASATVTSTYSEVISSADAEGSTARNRSIIESRHRRANDRWSRSTASSGNRSASTGSPTLVGVVPWAPSDIEQVRFGAWRTKKSSRPTADDSGDRRRAVDRGDLDRRHVRRVLNLSLLDSAAAARSAGRVATGAVRRARLSLRHSSAGVPEGSRRRGRCQSARVAPVAVGHAAGVRHRRIALAVVRQGLRHPQRIGDRP